MTDSNDYGLFNQFAKDITELYENIPNEVNDENIVNVSKMFLEGIEKIFNNSFTQIFNLKTYNEIKKISTVEEQKLELEKLKEIGGVFVNLTKKILNYFDLDEIMTDLVKSVGGLIEQIYEDKELMKVFQNLNREFENLNSEFKKIDTIINKKTNSKTTSKDGNKREIEEILEIVGSLAEFLNIKYKDKLPAIPTKDDFIDKIVSAKVNEELGKNSKKMEPLIEGMKSDTKVKATDYSKYLSKLENRNNTMRWSSKNDPWGTYQSVGGERYLTPKECETISKKIIKEVEANVKEDFVKNKLAFAMGTYQTRTNAEQRNINEETEQRLLKLEKENEQLKDELKNRSKIDEQNEKRISNLEQQLSALMETLSKQTQQVPESKPQPSITRENNVPKKSRIELIIEQHKQKKRSKSQPTSFVEHIKNSDGSVRTLC